MMKTGQIMIQEGLVSPGDVALALDVQEKNKGNGLQGSSLLLGMILCQLNLITPLDNFYVLKKHHKQMSVMDRLCEKEMAPRSRLEKIKAEADSKAIPFISFLLEKQIIPKGRLQQLLFDLFGIPLRSVSDIIFDQDCRSDLTSVIDRDLAVKLSIIPLHLAGNVLTLGLTDPDNLIFVRKLDVKFPQYRFLPVFIPFSGFKWFFPILYPQAQPTFSPPMVMQHPSAAEKAENGAGPETVSNPNLDKHVIARLFRQYETLRQGHESLNNHETYNYRLGLFADFIRDSYDEITAQNDCKTIQFYVRQQEGRAMVIATPADKNRKGKEITI
ncbi:hypothetical protein [Desulfobacter sp.]|uniref:hypothetical protein n=1 Tax=Desulfobacter sp. TaxID=2294 RepID=UPI003D0AF769